MSEARYTLTGHKTVMDMYDVKLSKTLPNVEVELAKLANGRFAVTGTNPETGMRMFKLVSKAKAAEISGEVTI